MVKIHGMAQTVEIADDGREVIPTHDAGVQHPMIHGMTETMWLERPLENDLDLHRTLAPAQTEAPANPKNGRLYRRHPILWSGFTLIAGLAMLLFRSASRGNPARR